MAEDELEQIKKRHARLREAIKQTCYEPGDILPLEGARTGQLGLSVPLIDESGRIWRLVSTEFAGEFIEFIGAPKDTAHIGPKANDPDVMLRASNAADAPYDERTCRRYPWAAAARIAYLQRILVQKYAAWEPHPSPPPAEIGFSTHRVRTPYLRCWQYTQSPSTDWPDWVQRQLQFGNIRAFNTNIQVLTPHGRGGLICNSGDWIVEAQGALAVVHASIFNDLFEELEKNGE